jgi:hypothetical protein
MTTPPTTTTTKLAYCEEVDERYCRLLSKLSFKQFCQLDDTNDNTDETGQQSNLATQYKMLINYCNTMLTNDCKMSLDYKFASGKEEGRIFVSQQMGLQRIWNKFRGVLCDSINLDFDMINAHPSILLYICRQNNIQAFALESYVNNRAQMITNFMNDDNITKGNAKTSFICSINDNTLNLKFGKKNIKNAFFLAFDKEMKGIQLQLCEKFPLEYKYITKREKENPEGKLTNALMCKYENIILQMAIKTATTMGLVVNVPMFDGFMVSKESLAQMPVETLITTLNELSSEYGVKWSNKEHNIELADKLDSMVFEKNVFCFIGDDEIEVVHYVLNNILNKKIYNCDGEVWLYNNLVWSNKKVKDVLSPILSKHDLLIKNIFGAEPCNKSSSGLDSLIKLVMTHAEAKPDFFTIMHSDTMQKLCYKNGFYDFKQATFLAYTNDNIPFTSFIINRDYVKTTNKGNEIYTRVLYPIFNVSINKKNGKPINDDNYKNMQYNLWALARKLAGHIEDKNWMLLVGERNSGKGIIQEGLMAAFEGYIGSFSSGVLLSKPTSCGETSKEQAWMMDFEFKRIMFASEIEMKTERGRHTTKLNGVLLKTLSSGGDPLTARTNNKDQRTFKIQSSIVLCANDVPQCQPADALETVQKFNMPCKFLTDEEYTQVPEGQKKSFVRKVKDTSLKTWLNELDVKNSFQTIILNAYNKAVALPASISASLIEEAADNSDYDNFLALFYITGKEEDTLSNKKLEEIMGLNNIPFTLIKATKYLKALGCTVYRSSNSRGCCGLQYAPPE